MSTTIQARTAVLSDMQSPQEDAEKLLAAYRAAVVTEVVEALQAKAGQLSDLAEEEYRRDLEEQAQEWHRAAAEAARFKKEARRP